MSPKKKMILLIGSILLFAVNLYAADIPAAFLPEQTYQFEPVIEGAEVVHDFILQNKGTAPLDIIDLKSG